MRTPAARGYLVIPGCWVVPFCSLAARKSVILFSLVAKQRHTGLVPPLVVALDRQWQRRWHIPSGVMMPWRMIWWCLLLLFLGWRHAYGKDPGEVSLVSLPGRVKGAGWGHGKWQHGSDSPTRGRKPWTRQGVMVWPHGWTIFLSLVSIRGWLWLLHPQQLQRLGCLDGSMGPQSHGQTMDGWFVPFDEKARSLFCPNISGLF